MTSVIISLQHPNLLLLMLLLHFVVNDINLSEFHLNSDSSMENGKNVVQCLYFYVGSKSYVFKISCLSIPSQSLF